MTGKFFPAMIFSFCAMLLLATSPAQAQRGGRGDGPGGPGGIMGNSSVALLNDGKVIQELELSEDQVDMIKDLQGEMRDIFRESFGGMRGKFRGKDVDREAVLAEIRGKIQSQMSSVEEKLEEILLPHQMTRLKELTIQVESRRGGTKGLLNNPTVREKLGLTEAQMEEVKAKAEEVKIELEEKIKQAREDAQNEILSVLTSEQQSQLKEMMGESFEFGKRGWGQGGDRGNRGGRPR